MMDKVIFGRYVPVDSVLHRMDPRSKLLIIFFFVCVVFIANNSLNLWDFIDLYHSNDLIVKGTYSVYPIGPHSCFMACSIYLAPSFIFYQRRVRLLWIGAGLKFTRRGLGKGSLFPCVFSYLYWLHRY